MNETRERVARAASGRDEERLRRTRTLLRIASSRAGAEETQSWSEEDWRRAVAEAERRDVAPLVYAAFVDHPDAVPPDARLRLAAAYGRSALENQLIQRQLQELLVTFDEAAIPVVVLKGGILAFSVYEEPALRPMGDLDVLVRDADVAAATGALERLGYAIPPDTSVDGYHVPFVRENGVLVELHRDLDYRGSAVRFDLDRLWSRATSVDVRGVRALGLAPPDQLLHLCCHAARHHAWGADSPRALPLRVLVDVARCADRLEPDDWREVVERARAMRAARFVRVTIAVLERALGRCAPPEVLVALGPHSEDDAIVDQVWSLLTAPPAREAPVTLANAAAAGTAAPWWRAVVASAFPPPARLRAMYGDLRRPLPALYVARLLDLLRRRGGEAAAFAVQPQLRRQAVDAARQREAILDWSRGEG